MICKVSLDNAGKPCICIAVFNQAMLTAHASFPNFFFLAPFLDIDRGYDNCNEIPHRPKLQFSEIKKSKNGKFIITVHVYIHCIYSGTVVQYRGYGTVINFPFLRRGLK